MRRVWIPILLLLACTESREINRQLISFRGLHASGEIVWASGTGGTVRLSTDGGQSWQDRSIAAAATAGLDLRDIHGFDENTAVAMSAGPGAASRLFRTTDGGHNWREVARCAEAEGFWDGIAFWNQLEGLLVGDPIGGRLALWRTSDGGVSWQALPPESRPQVADGEYCFAASGTSLCLGGEKLAWLATGGARARVLRSTDRGQTWSAANTPLDSGQPSAGIFSICMRDSTNGIIVGGDYQRPDDPSSCIARTTDGGVSWQPINANGIRGYRSGVDWQDGVWRTTGTNGTELSWDDGNNWSPLTDTGCNAVSGRVMAGNRSHLQLPQSNPQHQQTNILFFLVDDLGWQDTSLPFADEVSAQNLLYRTPALKRLARAGVKFTQAYAASPVCSPTRTSILSGRNPARTGITNWIPGEGNSGPEQQRWALPEWNQTGLRADDVLLPAILAANGYQTAHIGKAHFAIKGSPGADPTNLGFKVNIGGSHIGHPGSYLPPYGKAGHSHRVPGLDDLRESELYLNDALTAKALGVLDAFATNPDPAPFFIHFAHYAVHTPIQADPSRLGGYADNLPGSQRPYATMIESMDDSLGKMLQRLEQLGIADNTMVVFFSDNGGLVTHGGPPTTCAPLSGGKGTMREGGTRVPMVIRWPGHTAVDSIISTPIISDDFLPTLLDVAGVALPQQEFDGVSLLPLLQGNDIPPRDLLWHWPHYWAGSWLREEFEIVAPFSALRSGDWKVVWQWDQQRAELFNLADDIGEHHDLAPKQRELTSRMLAKLSARLRAVNAPRPRDHHSGEPVPWPGQSKVVGALPD